MSRTKPAAALSKNECPPDLIPLKTGNFDLAFDRKGQRLIVSIGVAPEALASAGPSKTGKTRVLSTTCGFVAVPVPGVDGLQLQIVATLPLT